MAAEGRNLLEVVLNTDIAKKFNAVDDAVDKIQASMNSAAESAKQFADALDGINKSFGDKSGFASFAENIQKLIESLNGLNTNTGAKGIEQTTKEISNLGDVSKSNIDLVNQLVEALNKIGTVSPTTDLAGYATENAQLTLKKLKDEIDTLKDKLFKTGVSREEEQALVDQLDVLKEIVKLRSESTQEKKKKEDAEAEKAEAKALKEKAEAEKAYIKHLKEEQDAKALRFKDSQDAYKQETKALQEQAKEEERIREDANKRRRAEIRQAFAEQDALEKQEIENRKSAEKEISSLLEHRLKLQEKQNKVKLKYTQEENTKNRASELSKLQSEYDSLGRSIEGVNKRLEAMKGQYKGLMKGEHAFADKELEQQIRYLEQYDALMLKIKETKASEAGAKAEQDEANALKRYIELAKEKESLLKNISVVNNRQNAGIITPEETSLLNTAYSYLGNITNEMKSLEQSSLKVQEYESEYVKSGKQQLDIARLRVQNEQDLRKAREEAAKQEQKNAKAAEDELNLLEQQIKARQDLARAQNETFSGAMGYSQRAKNIEQERQAIEYLKAARDKLNYSDKDYESKFSQLSQRIRQHEENIKKATGATEQFRQKNLKLNDVLQRVAGAFGVYIGLQSITNFARNVAQVTGEFEMQHRAMQAIIGDIDAANKLWDKTIALAVKSPYRVKDLVSYTKQLAAYRVETDKLYDTTKMLADISSGLGVDMQRLILAYGQVKAANYLRGQELRQFSEAGINILGELSKYFEEIKGQAVSTGEVFEMVSKRMVKFEDVSEVLKRLTQEGGTFFNMQEIQAETLQGKMMNLKDSFDIMMNSIGEKDKGVIVGFVDTIKKMVDNWEDVATILKIVVGLFVTFKIAQISAGVSLVRNKVAADAAALGMSGLSARLINLIAAEEGATAATLNLSMALKTLSISKGGRIGVAVSLLLTAAVAVYDYYRRSTELQKELNQIQIESAASTRKMTNQYNELASKIRDANTSESERAELMAKIKRLYGEILPDRLLNIDYIKKEGNAYTEATEKIKNYYQSLRREKEIQATEERYGKSVADSQQMLAKSIQHEIEQNHKRKVGMDDINAVLEEFKNRVDAGTASAENMNEVLKELIDNQTGIKLDKFDFENFVMQTGPGGGRDITGISRYLSSFYSDYTEYNNKMQELTGRTTEYLQTLKEGIKNNVFKIGDQNLDKQIDKMVANGEIGDDLKSKMEEKGKRAAKAYRQAFNIYLNTDEYQSLEESQKKEAVNLFEKMFDAKVAEHQMSNAQKVISSKVVEITNLFKLKPGQKSLLEELVIGKDEGGDDYYKRAKPKLEGFLTEIRNIRNGISETEGEEAKSLVEMEPAIKMFMDFLELLYGTTKTKGRTGNPALELLNKQIEAIKNASKQYEEYQKLYDDTTAFDKTKKAVQDLFGQLGIGGLLNKQGIFDKMTIQDQLKTWLSGQMAKAGKDGRIAIEKYIRELELQASQADFKNVVNQFKKDMDEAFADYDMYKELEKLGIGGELAKSLFKIDNLSITQLEETLSALRKKMYSKYNGKEAIEAYGDMYKKLQEMEAKETVERMKKYTKYLIEGRDEAVKIHLEELTQMAELDELYAKGYYTDTQYTSIADKIHKDTVKALEDNEWEQFKGSDFYTTMFEDLSHVAKSSITIMKDKLNELKGKMNELDPTKVKEIVQSIERLEKEEMSRSPLKSFVDDMNKLISLGKKRKENETLLDQLVGKKNELEERKKIVAEFVADLTHQYNEIGKGKENGELFEEEELRREEAVLFQINKMLEEIDKQIGIITGENNDWQESFNNVWSGVQKGAEYFNQAAEAAGQVSTEIMGMMDGIDDASKQLAEDIADFAGNTALLVKDIAAAIASEGTDVGAMIDGIIRTINIVKSGLSINEWDINAKLEKNAKALEELEYTYDRVKRASDRAWDTTDINKRHRETMSIIQDEINSYNKMIEAESARKSPDNSALEEYRRNIKKLYEQMDDDAEEFYERVGGIGAGNYGDAAQGFVDAWFEAFKETGDGLSGLQDHFNEVIENLVKRQAMQRLSKTLMQDLFEMIDNAAKNGVVTQSELDEINKFAEQQLPSWNKALKNFAQSLGFLGDQAEGELDGIQKGIQGVTEQTAEIIAAYMNTIRYYVIDNNTKLGQIISALQDSTGTFNPMVAELRNIRQQAEDIRNLLFSWRETGGVPSMRVTIV